MNRSSRRVFGLGVAAGVGAAALIAIGLGAGRITAGESFVTSSPDGRRAYLWSNDGVSLRFIASAEAPRGHDDKHDEHGKPSDDHGKPDDAGGKPDDKGKGKGKGK